MTQSYVRKWALTTTLATGLGASAALITPAPAAACGGLFCSATNPVNQAAEQIIFSDNGDGTVTAVIQIMYEGPPTEFAWVLPIPGNPTVGVSSTQALDAFKNATNPQYQLNTVLGESCPQPEFAFPGSATGAAGTGGSGSGGVSVLASGAIGPYLYDTIAVDPAAADKAEVALEWLDANGYDAGALGPEVLRPYLEDGLNLIAFRLSPASNTGSIRPVMITYDATRPSIPIRPTAVAANDDMGVLVWLLSDKRGIPDNYKALELNEALIDWFNPNNNYNEVVTRAADEAAGQGFVTEYAGTTDGTTGVFIEVFADWQREVWTQFQATPHSDAASMVQEATANWAGFDGLEEAFAGALTLPDGISIDDFKNCMTCYQNEPGVVFDTTRYLQQLYELVIKPLIETQKLLDQRPYLTRLYTTMSAAEMTMDPVFSFNADLADVSNVHTADRVIDCTGGRSPFDTGTPWTVELAQGAVVRGDDPSVWPVDMESQPAALKILQFATEGQGDVLEDNSERIADALGGVPNATMGGNGGGGDGGPVSTPGGPDGGTSGPTSGGGPGSPSGTADAGVGDDAPGASDGGCRAVGTSHSAGNLWALGLALIGLVRRRRRA